VKSGYAADMKLEHIEVFGVSAGPGSVTVNGQTAAFQYNGDAKVTVPYFRRLFIGCGHQPTIVCSFCVA